MNYNLNLYSSAVPAALIFVSAILICVSFNIIFFVFRANSFTSAVIEIQGRQSAITNGPYA